MQWDLGLQGAGLLLLMSLTFGLVAQAVLWKVWPRWVWLIAAGGFFVVGLLIIEVWFGWATSEELQPNIDGLSFDEVLLGLIPGVVAVLWIRSAARRAEARRGEDRRQEETTQPAGR